MKPAKDNTSPSAIVQEAFAQMESNAAAAMAKFKSFSRAQPASTNDTNPKQVEQVEEKQSPTGAHSPRLQDSSKSNSAHRDALAVQQDQDTRASKLAVLEEAATRYLQGHVHENQVPWHHQLRGTKLQFVSDVMDRPLALLILSAGCLTVGTWEWLWPFLLSLLSIQRLSLILGLSCLLLAVSGWILRLFAFMQSQMAALAETVPKMPQACDEMGQMLTEMKLMRVDLKSMKAKVAWLPGGE